MQSRHLSVLYETEASTSRRLGSGVESLHKLIPLCVCKHVVWNFRKNAHFSYNNNHFFAPYSLEYGKQNLPLKWVRFFTRCLSIELAQKMMLARVSESDFFSLNCSKFALECDWTSKNSQTVQNLFFFWKNRGVFLEKNPWNFSKSANMAIFFQNAFQMVLLLKNVFSALVMRFFRQKDQKTLNVGKIRNNNEEFNFEKKRFHFLKPLQKWEAAKYAGGSRPCC